MTENPESRRRSWLIVDPALRGTVILNLVRNAIRPRTSWSAARSEVVERVTSPTFIAADGNPTMPSIFAVTGNAASAAVVAKTAAAFLDDAQSRPDR